MELDNSDTIFNSPRWFFIAPHRGTRRNTRNWKGCSSLSKSPVVRQRHTPVNPCAAAPPLLCGAAPPTTRPHRGATSLMGISSSPSRFFYDFCNWSQRKERRTACRTQTPASRIVLSNDFLAPRKASKALTRRQLPRGHGKGKTVVFSFPCMQNCVCAGGNFWESCWIVILCSWFD